MSTRRYVKRRRLITACWECRRRKQKCDRMKPCNVCISRKAPDACTYATADVLDSGLPNLSSGEVSSTLTRHEGEVTTSAEPSTLIEQFGYSSVNHDHALSALERSLLINPSSLPSNGSLPRSMVHSFFTERYCQLAARLPSHSIITDLIDVYFDEADWYFLALDRYYIEESLSSWTESREQAIENQNLLQLSRDLHYFPALLFQILAVALQFLSPDTKVASALHVDESSSLTELSESYTKTGLEIVALLGRQNPTITSVEHDLMRLTWLKNCSRGAESWHFLSHCIRQAQSLGFHLEPDIKQQGPEESVESILSRLWYAEHKRRVWARLFILDAFMSLILGRPRQINKDDCTVKPPLDRDMPGDPSRTVFLPSSQKNSGPPCHAIFIRYLIDIAVKTHELLSFVTRKPYDKDYAKVQEFHRSLMSIVGDLPPALRPRHPDTSYDGSYPSVRKIRQQMVSTANSFLMNLHRPYVAWYEESRHAAVEAALRVLESQQLMFEETSEHQYRIYGFSFYTIDAGVLLESLVLKHPVDEKEASFERIRKALTQAISRLGLLGSKISIAKTGETILRQGLLKILAGGGGPPEFVNHYNNNAQGTSVAAASPLPPTPVTTSLQSTTASFSPPKTHARLLPESYQAGDDTLDPGGVNPMDPDQTFSPLPSVPDLSYTGGIYNYLEAAAAAAAAEGVATTQTVEPVGRQGAGTYPVDDNMSSANIHVHPDGNMFSYEFDENPYFFFSAGSGLQ